MNEVIIGHLMLDKIKLKIGYHVTVKTKRLQDSFSNNEYERDVREYIEHWFK